MEKERNRIIRILDGRIETHNISKDDAQNKLHEICDGLRKQIDDLENSINNEMEEAFNAEDNRLRTILNNISEKEPTDFNEISKEIQRAKAELLVAQLYDIVENDNNLGERLNFSNIYKLKIEKSLASLKLIDFEKREPTNLTVTLTSQKSINLAFSLFNEYETKILKPFNLPLKIEYKIWDREKGENDENVLTSTKDFIFGEGHQNYISIEDSLYPNTTNCIRIKAEYLGIHTKWSCGITDFILPEFAPRDFKMCVWKECHGVSKYKGFSLNSNKRIATKTGNGYCTIIGNTYLPFTQLVMWEVKFVNPNGGIWVGVAPSTIDVCYYYRFDSCGWYLQVDDRRIKSGDSVGMVMDTMKGELSFIIGGVNHGVAFKDIPLNKPLVPFVALSGNRHNSVELIIK